MSTTIDETEVGAYAKAVTVMIGTLNPIATRKVTNYLDNICQEVNHTCVSIDDKVAGLHYWHNQNNLADKTIKHLKFLMKVMRDNSWSLLDGNSWDEDTSTESRPQQDESQPEATAVTTTPDSTTGMSKRQLMEQTMRQMQELMSNDDSDTQTIALNVFREQFKPAFAEAVKDTDGKLGIEERIQSIVDSTPPKMDDEKVRLAVDAVVQSAFGTQVKQDLASGKKVLLPPIETPCPYFVSTPIAEEIEFNYIMGQHILVDGPSGSGKTYPIEQVLRKLGKRYIKINFADGIRLSDLTARQEIVVENGQTKTVYVDGLLTYAMRHGLPVIGDEADQAPQELMSAFNPTMDKFPGELLLPSGERVIAQPGFWVAMTGNTLTDETGLYSGYKPSNALTNRCSSIRATYLEPSDEISILVKDGLDQTEARMIVNVMGKLRDLYLNRGSVSQAPSTRQAVRISRYIQGKDVYGNTNANLPGIDRNRAFHLAFFNFLPKSEYSNAISEANYEDNEIKVI